MIKVHEYFKDADDIQILHITGDHEYDRVTKQLGSVNYHGFYGKTSRIIPYSHHMPAVLAAADLVVYRAGAVGLAELAARGLPSILIPYPYAAEDHQRYNAQAFVMNGAARMILDKLLTGEELLDEIVRVKEDRHLLQQMATASLAMGRTDAAQAIADIALELAGKSKFAEKKTRDNDG